MDLLLLFYVTGLCIGGDVVCNIGSEKLCGKRLCYIHLKKYYDDQLNGQVILVKCIYFICVFNIHHTIIMLINTYETELQLNVITSVIVIFTHMDNMVHLRSLFCTSDLFMLFMYPNRSIAWQSLYFNKGKLKGGRDYYYKHPWVFLTYRDLG